MQRIAILFDNTVRPETTGFYLRRALGALCEVEHFLPEQLDQLARGDHGRFDLFLAVDDGLPYELPRTLRPLAFWAIDTHVSFEQVAAKARHCDFVFAAQKDGAAKLLKEGITGVVCLPLACDPGIHRPHAVPKEYDAAFVGNLFPGPRQDLLDRIREQHPNTFVGNRYLDDMARTYSAARIVFNRSLANDVNMRVFEALGCGSLLLTNNLDDNGLGELFDEGRHLLTYRDEAELLEKIGWCLTNETKRERIAFEGRRHALARHTYRHRAQTILAAVDSQRRTSVAFSDELSTAKTHAYYEFARPEVVDRIPQSARRILDVGCGAGRLGQALKRRQPATVAGIERDRQAAWAAATRLDEVFTADIEGDSLDFEPASFDCVVCADVLEHLRHPERLLDRIRRWLDPEGTLIASIPNIQHHSVVTSLLAGNFLYESSGLLDETHLRFLTRREIEKLFFRAGFTIERLDSVPGPGDDGWWKSGRADEIDVGGLRITGLPPSRAREFYTYQYLVTAKPAPPPSDGVTSIILATHNQLDYTRLCLDSLRRFTDEPYELIAVDNGSTDGTSGFLRSCSDVRLIENSENRGFPAAVNQGIAAARGEQILLLNNDTVVTTGWLRRMLDALRLDAATGLVGPVSNNVSGPQQVAVSYQQLSDLDGFAWDWGKAHRGKIAETDRLVGFCLLIRKSVIDRIGLLDERFGIGNFEDDDYCRRALQSGFRCVIARDSFVHHFGGRTFLGSGVDHARLMAENERRYREKWQDSRVRPATTADASSPDGAIPPVAEAASGPRLSLCMIVRDNETTIVPCLESIRPWVDEMIVVDTGSSDRTAELCRELGAKVFHFPWCDDFSAARNESVKDAGGEWIFWMDSDDTIPDACGQRLRQLADGPHDDRILGYVMQVHCPSAGGDATGSVTVVDHVKLFRNRPDLRFEHHIHEQILPAIRRAGGEVAFTDIHVVHSGSDHTPKGRQRKLERDFRLLELDLAERPGHPFVLFNLGMTHNDAGQHDQAIRALEECLFVSHPHESHVRKAYALLVASLSQSGRHEKAAEASRLGLQLFPDDPELLFRQAMLSFQAGRLRDAEAVYLRLIDMDRPPAGERHSRAAGRPFRSRDDSLTGWKARHNLALVYDALEEHREAERWRQVTAERRAG